jgi:two-component system response regulator FlrC
MAVRDGQEALVLLERQPIWLIVADLRMPRMGGVELLREVKRRAPATHIVLITGYATVESAIEAVRLGASDYILKPFDQEALTALVMRLECDPEGQGQPGTASSPQALLDAAEGASSVLTRCAVEMIAQDPAMTRIIQTAEAVATSQATILIQGESGTGKEVLARYIHSRSTRAHRPFVAVNCAALPDGLLESELFGFERGAFTGALSRRPGKFEQAHGGTLLLDEISEMNLPLQSKLLRVIQEREVDRLGGKSPISVDIRILATTNRSLRQEVEAGRFREDLYYRLHVFPITIPSLRERRSDILSLAEHFLRSSATRNGKDVREFGEESKARLLARSWKGNVRELENVIERAVLLASGNVVQPQDIVSDTGENVRAEEPASLVKPSPGLVGGGGGEGVVPTMSIWEMERALIFQTLERVNGNRTHAAKLLDISIRTLRNKLREYRQLDSAPANLTGQRLPGPSESALTETAFGNAPM